MKRKYLFILISVLFSMASAISVIAQEVPEEVKLDENNFPSKYVRKVLYDDVDRNGDYILQRDEILSTTKLGLLAGEDYGEYGFFEKEDHIIIDCKGLEYFQNLEELYIMPLRNTDMDYGIINFESVYQLKKIKRLNIWGDKRKVKKWYFNRFPNLKYLNMQGVSGVEKIKFGNNIKTIKLLLVSGRANLNLISNNKLETFSALDYELQKIKFGKNKSLKKINIWSSSGSENDTIKSIDVSKLKNLKYLKLYDCAELKRVKFGKNKKLVKLSILCYDLKKINLKKCKISKKIIIFKSTKIKDLDEKYRKKIRYVD